MRTMVIYVRTFFKLLDGGGKAGIGNHRGGCVFKAVQHEQSIKAADPNQHCIKLSA